MKKIDDMTVVEIEEYLASILTDVEVNNLYMRCLKCGEYVQISQIADFEQEECEECCEESEDYDDED